MSRMKYFPHYGYQPQENHIPMVTTIPFDMKQFEG